MEALAMPGTVAVSRQPGPRRGARAAAKAAGGGKGRRPPAGKGGKGFGRGAAEEPQASGAAPTATAPAPAAPASSLPAAASAAAAAPPPPAAAPPPLEDGVASRASVLSAAVGVSLAIAGAGVALHWAAPFVAPAGRDGHAAAVAALLAWPPPAPGAADLGVAAAAAAAVTAGRVALAAAWPAFAASADASNRAVLTSLRGRPADVALVAALPAAAEELLFRGALLPAVYPDWRGAAVAGAVFGALHAGGGRGAPYAAWAAAVGTLYGAAFLATGNLAVPVLAHAAANLAAAALWLRRHPLEGGAAP